MMYPSAPFCGKIALRRGFAAVRRMAYFSLLNLLPAFATQ
jgi:hypothetical protein